LAAIGEIRKDGWTITSKPIEVSNRGREPRTSDFVSRTAFAGRYHDEKLHDGVIDARAA
jgi:hypothetical protein